MRRRGGLPALDPRVAADPTSSPRPAASPGRRARLAAPSLANRDAFCVALRSTRARFQQQPRGRAEPRPRAALIRLAGRFRRSIFARHAPRAREVAVGDRTLRPRDLCQLSAASEPHRHRIAAAARTARAESAVAVFVLRVILPPPFLSARLTRPGRSGRRPSVPWTSSRPPCVPGGCYGCGCEQATLRFRVCGMALFSLS